jgi:hypothetical protein
MGLTFLILAVLAAMAIARAELPIIGSIIATTSLVVILGLIIWVLILGGSVTL